MNANPARQCLPWLLLVATLLALAACTAKEEAKPIELEERIPLVREALAEPMDVVNFRRAEYAEHLLRLLGQPQSADALHSYMLRQISHALLGEPLDSAKTVREAIAFEMQQPERVAEKEIKSAFARSPRAVGVDPQRGLLLPEHQTTVHGAAGHVWLGYDPSHLNEFDPKDTAERQYRSSACEQKGTCAEETAAAEKRKSERSLSQQWKDIPWWAKWTLVLGSIGITLFARQKVPPEVLIGARIVTALSALPLWPLAWELWGFDFGGNHDGAPSGIVLVIPIVYGLAFICTLLPLGLIWLALRPLDDRSPLSLAMEWVEKARDWYQQRYQR